MAVATIHSIPDTINVEEGTIPYIQVCATLSVTEDTRKDITILASRNDKGLALAAMDGFDYEFPQTFASGSMNGDKKCIRITLLDDSIAEEVETFALTWTTLDSRVVLDKNLTIITIFDNDG